MSKFDDVLSGKSRAHCFPRKAVEAALRNATAPESQDCATGGVAMPVPACAEREIPGNDMNDALRRSDLEQARIRDRDRQ